MNLKDLSRLEIKDLQKIDYKHVLDTLRKRNDLLMNIVISGIAFLVIVHSFSQAGQKIRLVKSEIDKSTEKITAIKNFDGVKGELDGYIAKVPQGLNADQIVNFLTELAVTHRIKIVSVSPANSDRKELQSITSIQLAVTANDFKDLWLFIYDIERSPHALYIKEWEGSLWNPYGSPYYNRGDNQANPNSIQARLNIISVNVKKEYE